MNVIQRLRKQIVPVAIDARCRIVRRCLRRDPRDVASRLASAIDYAVDQKVSREERAWMDRIEARRADLLSSSDTVEIEDFGAVSSEISLDTETMQKGKFVVRTVGDMCASAAKPPFWTRLLFGLVRNFEPKSGLELGTCLGVSASYQAAAMELNGGGGRLTTLEGSRALAARARETFSTLNLGNVTIVEGGFHQTLDGALDQYGPIDYAFIDGHHHEQSTLDYFEKIRNRAARRACLVFDDIRWSGGMLKAWNEIASHDSVAVSADLYSVGVAIVERN